MVETLKGTFAPMLAGAVKSVWGATLKVKIVQQSKIGATVEDNLIGLIDTGADYCRIDTGVAQRYGLTALTKIPTNNAGVIVNEQSAYWTRIELSPSIQMNLVFVQADFRSTGAGYDFLLGMDFLHHFSLSISMAENSIVLAVAG